MAKNLVSRRSVVGLGAGIVALPAALAVAKQLDQSTKQAEDNQMITEERIHSPDAAGLRMIKALRDYIPHIMAKNATPGLNIALADQGRLIWEAGFGWADIAAKKPMTPDTTYHSGSLGKTYTGTAVMILVDRGVIALSDPINKYLPFEAHNPLGSREITVHDLMVHKSGLTTDTASPRWEPDRSLAQTLEVEYSRANATTMGGILPRWSNPVGAKWMYSNTGIATLGLIVERANPQHLSFSEFVKREVMDPLGMKLSQYPPAEDKAHVRPDIWANASTGYSRMGMVDIPSFPLCFAEFAAGGVMACPADHIRLLLAMINGGELDGNRLFTEASAKAMISPATELVHDAKSAVAFPSEQGLIWRLNDYGTPDMSFDHGGGHMYGWRTQGRGWPRHRAAVMVAANQWSQPDDSTDVQEVTEVVATWLKCRSPVDVDSQSALDAKTLSYARGALLAASYRFGCAVPDRPPMGQFRAVIAGVRSRGRDWDEHAFTRGFEAVMSVAPTNAALKAFWVSPACEIDTATLHTAYVALGGKNPGLLTSLLPN